MYPAAVVLSAVHLFLALCVPLFAVGCGADDEKADETPEAQVRAVVERFAQATANKDYQTICDALLASTLVRNVERLGLPCEVALQRGLGEVRAPRLEIRQIVVRGNRALVSVHSTAAGQAPSDDALELVTEDEDWKIASLATPAGTGTTTSPPATTTTGP
jgi:hypothetical protein